MYSQKAFQRKNITIFWRITAYPYSRWRWKQKIYNVYNKVDELGIGNTKIEEKKEYKNTIKCFENWFRNTISIVSCAHVIRIYSGKYKRICNKIAVRWLAKKENPLKIFPTISWSGAFRSGETVFLVFARKSISQS